MNAGLALARAAHALRHPFVVAPAAATGAAVIAAPTGLELKWEERASWFVTAGSAALVGTLAGITGHRRYLAAELGRALAGVDVISPSLRSPYMAAIAAGAGAVVGVGGAYIGVERLDPTPNCIATDHNGTRYSCDVRSYPELQP
jgi:hypothetical protein